MRKLFIAIALALSMLAIPSTASALTFGMHTPDDPFKGNTRTVDGLQRDLDRRIGVVSWFQNWNGSRYATAVLPHAIRAVRAKRRLPLITWEPWRQGEGPNQPEYSLRTIASGAHDAFIRSWAQGLRGKGTIYLRPMHEMNGNWYPWAGAANGNNAALYKLAWRRMWLIFRASGATNVKFVWSPVTEDTPVGNRFEKYYPGRRFVDVLGLDGYNWGDTRPEFGGWRSFHKTFAKAYKRIGRLGPQPIWIAETGSTTLGGNKAAWVRQMFRSAKRMKRLKVIVWMDTSKSSEGDWRARSSPAVARAFRAVPRGYKAKR